MNQIKFVGRDLISKAELTDLVDAAANDKYLGDFVYTRAYPEKYKPLTDSMTIFLFDNEPVGFAIPRRDSDGRWRTGAIFVKEEFRGKGIAGQFVREFFEGKKGRAYIEKTNVASQALYKSAGFYKTNKQMKDGWEVLYQWLKD